MDLIDKLKQIGERISKLKEQVETEEATKNAFILPFIQALGYDVFNPLEVSPEFTADIGTKKGEKVDYCIIKDGVAAILIECKHWKKKLDTHKSQLHRYFHATNARFAILTNGIKYQFFTDLVKKNVMDDKPFLEFSMDNITETKVNPIKQFHKESFDVDAIIDSASGLKYTKEIKELIHTDLLAPSEDFVKFYVSKVYSGRVTTKVIDQFLEIVKQSVKSLLNDMINERLQSAIDKSDDIEEEEEDKGPEIITTDEELQGFRVVQAILLQKIDNSRIAFRDKKSYFGVLLDNNNRKPICRLHFNGNNKYIELFDADKNSEKVAIEKIGDIYRHSDRILEVVDGYDG